MTAIAYLSCMAVINGAKSVDEVAKTLRAGFGKVLRVRAVVCSRSLQHEVTTLVLTDYVDDVARVHRLRAAVLAAGDVGAVLQLHAVPHRGEFLPLPTPTSCSSIALAYGVTDD